MHGLPEQLSPIRLAQTQKLGRVAQPPFPRKREHSRCTDEERLEGVNANRHPTNNQLPGAFQRPPYSKDREQDSQISKQRSENGRIA